MNDLNAGISLRRTALIAGIALLLMAILAPFANFYVLEGFAAAGDAAATFDKITAGEGLLRAAIGAFLVVAVLDIVVAWALYFLFEQVNRSLSLLAAWLRVAYAAMLGIALTSLTQVVLLVSGNSYLQGIETNQLHAQVSLSLATFQQAWNLGLVIFGFSLLLVGFLAFKSGFTPKLIGILLIIAAAGYLVDGFGIILVPGYSFKIAAFTFIGEPVFMVWLFWKSYKGFDRMA